MEHSSHAALLRRELPHRLPKHNDFCTAVITANRRSRLDTDPLAAIEIIAKRRPEVFIQ